jgi:hypothetical protein
MTCNLRNPHYDGPQSADARLPAAVARFDPRLRITNMKTQMEQIDQTI